ncbi:MAG: 4Fe-4S dicluster domain-containing protein [Hyphomicrobiales bacterium]|nr:4Fe-4S dicluster domain-containing protein [Hyphomicrobiales bacterium]
MQHGFYFDKDLCVKCHACEIACKTWNEVEVGPRWREVVKIESGEFPDVKAMNVSMACMHCGDAPCRTACPVGAITKRAEDGIVVVDQNTCIGCGFCAWACPFSAPQLTSASGKMQKCNFCQTPGNERPLDMPRACEEVCPTGAIKSGMLAQMAQQNRTQVAAKLGANAGMQGFPGVVVDGHNTFGPGGAE